MKHEKSEEIVVLAITLNGLWMALAGLLGAGVASAAIVAPGMIDLSNNNGARAALAIAAPGVQAVEAKTTEGLGYLDRDYSVFRLEARRAHRAFGGYLFLHPHESGSAQAVYFLRYATPRPGDIQPVVDSETGSPYAAARATYGALHALALRGYQPILYASSSYLRGLVAADPRIKTFRVWQAEYGAVLHFVAGTHVIAWQFTDRADAAGFSVDGSHLLVRSVALLEIRPPRPLTAARRRAIARPAAHGPRVNKKPPIRRPRCTRVG